MTRPARGFFDDRRIRDTDTILRIVSPKNVDWPSTASAIPEITSKFFQDYSEDEAARRGLPGRCASVAVERLVRPEDPTLEICLRSFTLCHGIVAFLASAVRDLKGLDGAELPQGLMMDPLPDEPWHAVMYTKRGGTRTKAEKKAVARVSHWVRLPRHNDEP